MSAHSPLKQNGCVLCDVKEKKSCLLGVKGHQPESGAAASEYLTKFFVAALWERPVEERRTFSAFSLYFCVFQRHV